MLEARIQRDVVDGRSAAGILLRRRRIDTARRFAVLFGLTVALSLLLLSSASILDTVQQRWNGALSQGRRLTAKVKRGQKANTRHLAQPAKGNRILYIVTTLAEYNTGTRNTVKGSDRLQETLIPILSEGVTTMVQAGYHVDVYLICHFEMKPERLDLVRRSLPPHVGLDVWSDATPLGYDTSSDKPDRKLEYRTLHLARQHRFVIKDKFLLYDVFVVFEDDMLIKATHVDHFVAVTEELQRLAVDAPDDLPSKRVTMKPDQQYFGDMTKGQLLRMMPGLIRVEVLLDEANYGAQSDTGPVPVDLSFDGKASHVDPEVCCHVSTNATNPNRPSQPSHDKLMLWETNILPLGVRRMPEKSWLNWVVLQRGPNQGDLKTNRVIGDYWTNRNKDFYGSKTHRPAPQEFKYINNQGGWMATRDQMWHWHNNECPGGFLPPYEGPHYHHDGLDMRNVEWYSGGMQLSTVRHACNLQRIILLEPHNFSKSLLYHSANNKQRQLHDKQEEMFSKANTLLGQLNTIKKRAEKDVK